MSTNFEPNDELCRLWQEPDQPKSNLEVNKIMELVETRATKFEQAIVWRNVREYAAGGIVAIAMAVAAYFAPTPLGRMGYATVSAGGLWIILFMWLMQRSSQTPLPESSGALYEKALLAKYDRQILLLRTAWAWYVLPLTAGLAIANLGNEHAPASGLTMAYFVFGAAIAMLNWMAAKSLAAEKRELQRLLQRPG